MLITFQSHLHAVDVDAGHDHREFPLPVSLREVAAVSRPAVRAIEVLCRDALPMSENGGEEFQTMVWKHFE
jgi:hypothetical protein